MARATAIRLDAGWKKYKRALSVYEYSVMLKRLVRRATERNALFVRSAMRREITRGVPPTNAPLTIALKGGRGRPLVGTPNLDLLNSIAHEQPAWNRAIVGVSRTVSRGGGTWNIAEIVHEGATVRVTRAMRYMFGMLAWASMRYRTGKPIPHLEGRARELWEMSKRKRFFMLGPATTHIVIPRRPFVRYTFQDRALRARVQREWERAINASFREIARRGG